jgi:hypothetical protein
MGINVECKVTSIDHKDRPIERNKEIEFTEADYGYSLIL